MTEKVKIVLSVAVVLLLIFPVLFFAATPTGRTLFNNWFFAVQKADDATSYVTLKGVEDTCRSMIASYYSDKQTYEQYKDSDSEEKQSWAEQARMRANKTAASYNEYILKNSFVWKNGVPDDIAIELPYI